MRQKSLYERPSYSEDSTDVEDRVERNAVKQIRTFYQGRVTLKHKDPAKSKDPGMKSKNVSYSQNVKQLNENLFVRRKQKCGFETNLQK